ncbi:MAG TPA: HD domain-containing protein [Candidatus Saccharibacteria bacterium]|nr:HD domain-containing protein [Candidatus Saccharibacteria bacterium]
MKLLHEDSQNLTIKLNKYLSKDEKYRTVFDYTKKRFNDAPHLTAHNWAHAYRDTINAIVIGEAEKADMSIVLPAITMHDIGFLYGATGRTHGAIGAEKVAEFLHEAGVDYSDEQVQKIADCIRTHKGSMHDEVPESLEAKVVADADLLEKFGPFGVYQLVRTFGEFNYPLEKILSRKDEIQKLRLETLTGQKLAEPARQFVSDFFSELAEANEPYTQLDT